MKLLFDANLSPKLVHRLTDLFPGSVHLFDIPLPRDAQDLLIWRFAGENGYDIITTDGDDYPPLLQKFGMPPRVVLLQSWRYPTRRAEEIIRANAIIISEFANANEGLLILRYG